MASIQEKEEARWSPPTMGFVSLANESALQEKTLDAEANIPHVPAVEPAADKPTGPEPLPNGGIVAWVQVLGCFILFFNAWGTVNTFGVYQTYYEVNLLADKSPSQISWIGSIQNFLLLVVGVLTGPLFDKGYCRLLVITGSVLIPFGFMMTSLCKEYWQLMLAQGLCIGLGNGMLFIPAIAILPQYFSTKKALANGLAAAGSSCGGVIYPIVFRQLYPRIGFGSATRVLGFISLGTCMFAVILMRPRIMPKQTRALLDLAAFKEVPYTLFSIATFFGFIGFYIPSYYIQSYAIDLHITDVNLGFYLLPILNAASFFGRILPNYLSDKTGPMNIFIPVTIITTVVSLSWVGIHSAGGVIAFALLYGFFSGGIVSLPPIVIVSLTPDMGKLGTRMGQCFFVSAMGLLIGSPASGAILHSTRNYLGLQLFCGFTILVTTFLVFVARTLKVGWKLRVVV